jgi:hypothetical protein
MDSRKLSICFLSDSIQSILVDFISSFTISKRLSECVDECEADAVDREDPETEDESWSLRGYLVNMMASLWPSQVVPRYASRINLG